MTEIVNRVHGQLDERCLVRGRLMKSGCRVSMRDAPRPRVVIDFDRPGSPLASRSTRCDYLFFSADPQGASWVAPLELKRGTLDVGEAARQLQQGASAAERLISASEAVGFRPVAASGSVSKAARMELKKTVNRIKLHGHREATRMMKCGAPLAPALGSWPSEGAGETWGERCSILRCMARVAMGRILTLH